MDDAERVKRHSTDWVLTPMAFTPTFDTMTFKERLEIALREAETADRDSVRSATLRLVHCAIKDRDVSARSNGDCDGCPDAVARDVLKTMAAQREVSAREYDEAGRISDAEREREELEIIQEFLPQPLQGEALEAAVDAVVRDLEASKLKDVGRCMAELKSRYPGRIQTGKAGKAVKAALGQ